MIFCATGAGLTFSKDGYSIYRLSDMDESGVCFIDEYRVKIPYDWTQPAENYTFIGRTQTIPE